MIHRNIGSLINKTAPNNSKMTQNRSQFTAGPMRNQTVTLKPGSVDYMGMLGSENRSRANDRNYQTSQKLSLLSGNTTMASALNT